MLSSLVASLYLGYAVLESPRNLRILFLGNSHTVNNDVPGMVKALLESSGTFRVVAETRTGAFLTDIWENRSKRDLVKTGKWDVVVLQAAKLSSSHRHNYSHSGAINLAKLALQNKSKVFLFAEWPRRGWDESRYILGEYGEIAAAAKGVRIMPIPQTWDRVRKKKPALNLWQPDGNHASLIGSFLAACVIAREIGGRTLSLRWNPPGLEHSIASFLRTSSFQ